MHELSIARSVVDAACERAGGRPIHSIWVQAGALTTVVLPYVDFGVEAHRTRPVAVNPRVQVLALPATTGENVDSLATHGCKRAGRQPSVPGPAMRVLKRNRPRAGTVDSAAEPR